MIEINLIPDVKQELIHAQRQRTLVISGAILVTVVAGALAVLMGLYVFVIQGGREWYVDGQIKDKFAKLEEVKDLSKVLTLQSQVASIGQSHSSAGVFSRAIDVQKSLLKSSGEHHITINTISIKKDQKTITLDGTGPGYDALEAFKKTVVASSFTYKQAGDEKAKNVIKFLTDKISNVSPPGFSQQDGERVVSFSLQFTYPEELFARSSMDWSMIGIDKHDVTDSTGSVPKQALDLQQRGGQ